MTDDVVRISLLFGHTSASRRELGEGYGKEAVDAYDEWKNLPLTEWNSWMQTSLLPRVHEDDSRCVVHHKRYIIYGPLEFFLQHLRHPDTFQGSVSVGIWNVALTFLRLGSHAETVVCNLHSVLPCRVKCSRVDELRSICRLLIEASESEGVATCLPEEIFFALCVKAKIAGELASLVSQLLEGTDFFRSVWEGDVSLAVQWLAPIVASCMKSSALEATYPCRQADTRRADYSLSVVGKALSLGVFWDKSPFYTAAVDVLVSDPHRVMQVEAFSSAVDQLLSSPSSLSMLRMLVSRDVLDETVRACSLHSTSTLSLLRGLWPGRVRSALAVEDGRGGEEEAPAATSYCCPISLCPCRHPVVASDGHTYERDSIVRVICESEHPLSPMTNLPLTVHLHKNFCLPPPPPPP